MSKGITSFEDGFLGYHKIALVVQEHCFGFWLPLKSVFSVTALPHGHPIYRAICRWQTHNPPLVVHQIFFAVSPGINRN